MRRFLLIALCLPAIAAAQGVRFDQYNMTSANNVPFGAQAPIYTLPSSKVTVCAYPDDGGQPCGNVIPIYSDPALTQTADNPITADVHGRFGLWLAPGTYTYSVVTQSGTFVGTYIFTLGGSGSSSGGCSTGGIPTTNGSVTGDNTSTNCGYNNRTGDTAAAPADTQTFGANLLDSNSGTDNVAMGIWAGDQNTGGVSIFIGDSAGQGNTGDVQIFIGDGAGQTNDGDTVVAIGESAGAANKFVTGNQNLSRFSDFIGANSGWQNSSPTPAVAAGRYLDCMGFDTCRNMHTNGDNIVGIGAFSSNGESGSDIVGIGNASGGGRSGSNIIGIGDGAADNGNANIASPGNNVVGIGNGAASGLNTGSGNEVVALGDHPGKTGVGASDVVAIGERALQGTFDGVSTTGTELIGIGHFAMAADTTGSDNVAIGKYAGANGFGSDNGNANLTGSNNTWIGDFSGPNVTTQLSNTIALGYQAFNTASNQTVIGNSSTTEAHINGTFFTPASSTAACTVPEFADDANFHYVCTATNTWKRVALSSF